MLQVGVGHEGDNGVEGEGGLHGADAVGVEDRQELDAQDQVADKHHDGVGKYQSQGVFLPAHALILIDTADAVDSIVDAVEHGIAKRMLTSGDVEHIAADRDDQQHENHQGQNDLQHCKIPPLCLRTFPGWPGRTPDSTPAR